VTSTSLKITWMSLWCKSQLCFEIWTCKSENHFPFNFEWLLNPVNFQSSYCLKGQGNPVFPWRKITQSKNILVRQITGSLTLYNNHRRYSRCLVFYITMLNQRSSSFGFFWDIMTHRKCPFPFSKYNIAAIPHIKSHIVFRFQIYILSQSVTRVSIPERTAI